MATHRIIHIDLDGVLADFYKGFMDATGCAPEEFSKDVMWAHVASVPQFFLHLDLTPEANTLFSCAQTLGEVRILTAVPRKTTYPTAAKEKRQWVAKHFGDIPITVVQYAREKAAYAKPSDILVDDSSVNINKWVEAGGQGIIHADIKSTIIALKSMYMS